MQSNKQAKLVNLSFYLFLIVAAFATAGLLTQETKIGAAIWDWLTPELSGVNCEKLEPCRRSETTCGFGMQPYYLDGEYNGCMSLDKRMTSCSKTLRNEGSMNCKPDASNKYVCVCP